MSQAETLERVGLRSLCRQIWHSALKRGVVVRKQNSLPRPPDFPNSKFFTKIFQRFRSAKTQVKIKTLGFAQTHEEIISSTFYTFATCGRPPKWVWEGRKASGISFTAINSLKPQRSPKKPSQAF